MFYFLFFRTGKTVISKQKSIETAENDETKEVYFISLVACDGWGRPIGETPYVFDICTKHFDLKNTKVNAIDVPYLLNFFKNHRLTDDEDISNNVYRLLEFFVRNKPNGHFVVDEVPIVCSKDYVLHKTF